MKLEWSEEYSVGNEEIDNQHKNWIGLYNKLDDMMKQHDHADMRKTKEEVLQEMSKYVDYHFSFEEEYMRSIGFPEVDRHWRLHKDFRNQIYSICRDQQEGRLILNSEVMDTIRNWLVEHIIQEDSKLRAYSNNSSK